MPILEGFRKPPSWKGWVSSGGQCPCQPQTLACVLGSDRPLPLKVLTCVCVPACTQAAALIEKHGLDDTTYLYDLGNTTRLFRAWRGALPRVTPFYAVKCNPEVRVVHDIPRSVAKQHVVLVWVCIHAVAVCSNSTNHVLTCVVDTCP